MSPLLAQSRHKLTQRTHPRSMRDRTSKRSGPIKGEVRFWRTQVLNGAALGGDPSPTSPPNRRCSCQKDAEKFLTKFTMSNDMPVSEFAFVVRNMEPR